MLDTFLYMALEKDSEIKEKQVYRTVFLRVSEFEFKKFKGAMDIGYTQKRVIQKLIECNGVEFTIFDKDGLQSVTFPKNFLKEKNK